MIGPVVVGWGTPIFDGKPPVALRLVGTRIWDGSGTVLVRYEVSERGLEADWAGGQVRLAVSHARPVGADLARAATSCA